MRDGRVLGVCLVIVAAAACGGDDAPAVDAPIVDAPEIDAADIDAAIDAPIDAPNDGPMVGPCYTTAPGPNMLAPPPMITFAAPTIDLSSARGDSVFQAEGHMATSPVNGAALFAYISITNMNRTF